MSQIIESIPSAPVAPSFRSRWGYHPCSPEDFLMLKRLNKLAERALRLAYAQWRWDRKTVNRGVRWERAKDAAGRTTGWLRHEGAVARPDAPLPWTKGHWRCGSRPRGFVIRTEAHRFRALYREARMPQPVPVPPFSASVLADARGLLARLEAWRDARDGR